MNVLQKWMAKASPTEKSRLAKLLSISRGSLQWIAGSYRTEGKIDVSPELAREIEQATEKLAREGLAPVPREKLCAACGRCEYVKAAKKQ